MRYVVVVAMLLLAGCSDDSPAKADDETPSGDVPDLDAPDGSAAKQSTGGGQGSGENKRPLLTFAASVTQGPGPLHVSFTIKGLDDDDDKMSWRLDADGDGATDAEGALDGTVSTAYVYRVKGTYEATAWLSDGKDEVDASVTITVQSSEPIQTEEADLLLQVEGCFVPTAYDTAGSVPGGSGSAAGGLSRLEFDVNPDTVGRPFEATWTFDTGYLTMAWFFVDGSGNVVSSAIDDSPNFGNYQQTGEVPEGAAHGVFFGCGGPADARVEYVA